MKTWIVTAKIENDDIEKNTHTFVVNDTDCFKRVKDQYHDIADGIAVYTDKFINEYIRSTFNPIFYGIETQNLEKKIYQKLSTMKADNDEYKIIIFDFEYKDLFISIYIELTVTEME